MFISFSEGRCIIMSELLKFIGIKELYHKYIYAVIILVIGWILVNLIINITTKAMKKSKLNAGIISFTLSILKVSLQVILIIITLITLEILDTSSMITALSAITLAAGIAMKTTISNFASGFIIILNKVFLVGDRIKIGDDEGIVSKIEILFTTLTTDEGDTIIVPNSSLMDNSIKNYHFQKEQINNES